MSLHGCKRTLLRVLLLLIGGTIINIAMAWGCALFVPVVTTKADTQMSCDDREGWAVKHWKSPGMDFLQSMRSSLLAPVAGRHAGLPRQGDPKTLVKDSSPLASLHPLYANGERGQDDRAVACWGWPLLSMWCEYDMFLTIKVNGGIATPKVEPDYSDYYPGFRRVWPRALPLRLIWPGFAINTVFYTAVLWLLFAAPGRLRRSIRWRRGQCPECAYPVGTSNVCTECGKPLR